MNASELKDAIALKTTEFESAMTMNKPHAELMQIYKELKELKYQLVQAENLVTRTKDFGRGVESLTSTDRLL